MNGKSDTETCIAAAAAAAKSLQPCMTPCNPIDGSMLEYDIYLSLSLSDSLHSV